VLLESDELGRLTRVVAGVDRADRAEATVLEGLTLPGLVNAHSHAFHRGLRGRTQSADGGSFWTWREKMYRLAERLQPDTYRALASAVFAEMVCSGITTVGEFHYLHHDHQGRRYADDAMGAALIGAAADAGIRITLLDTCYLAGGVGRDVEGVQRRFADDGVEAWASRLDGLISAVGGDPTVRFGAAIHSVRAVPPESAKAVVAWAEQHDAPLHAHVSEQPAENEACLDAYGLTPTQLLGQVGALGPRFTAVHATHLADTDFQLLGGSGSSVCLCPTTERDLADGIGEASRLRQAGAGLCLGSDSHAVIDLWEEARAVELDERLASGQRGHHAPSELLRAAAQDGAAALGWPEAGWLEPGRCADFCTLDTDSVNMGGALGPAGQGAAAAAVFAAGARDVTNVVVAGQTVVAGGRHLFLDGIGDRLTRSLRDILRDDR
jgi:formiminoglutamate deiminase